MNSGIRSLGLLILLASLWVYSGGHLPGPTPPSPPDAPRIEVPEQMKASLESGFKGKPTEAQTWAGLLYGLARTIEADAGHPGGPRLKTMTDIEALRDWVVKCPPQPVAGGETIGQALGPELAKLGTSTEILDQDGRRANLVKLLDGAGQVLEAIR